MSEVTNEEIQELLNRIHERTKNIDINDETVRQWSREDVDKLLNATRRIDGEAEDYPQDDAEQDSFDDIVPENETEPEEGSEKTSSYEKAEEEYTEDSDDDIIVPAIEDNRRESTRVFRKADASQKKSEEEESPEDKIKEIMNSEASGIDAKSVLRNAKLRFLSIGGSLKKNAKKFAESLRTDVSEEDSDGLQDDFEDNEDDYDTDTNAENTEEDEDVKVADFSSKKKKENDASDNEKTVLIEKPGFVIKKSSSEEGAELEGAPIIMSADDALANDRKAQIPTIERMQKNHQSKLREAQEDGQIILSGFEDSEEDNPDEIDEEKAERELFEKRKKKIDNFVLFGDDDDPYGSESEKEKLGELFDTHDDRPRRSKEVKKFDGVEYEQTKDARRVQRYINSQKKKSLQKFVATAAIMVLSVIMGIAASAKTYVGGDRFLTIFFSLVLITAAIIVSGQEMLESFALLKKKRINLNTMVYFSAMLCFVQTLMMQVLYFFDKNSVSVFACAGVGMLLLSAYNNYIINCRTYDAMEFCTGDNKDKLYSIESITDDKDILEFGKYSHSKSPRIRYSCKTRFPSHLVEMCMSETAVDRRSRLLFIIIGLMGIINFIVAWVINKKFAVGFSALTITFSLCVPSYSALLVQLPLRWTNRRINRAGALISSQEAVNELYRTNTVVLDSRDLFDRDECAMLGFKDFKNVRMDDAMIYAAAMVIRSGGPLTGVFDQMVVNRRDILPTVKSFSYEEKMGVSGWIYNQKVILGNRTMMTNHNVEIPAGVDEDRYLMRGHEVMYLAIAHKLAAMIVVDYAPNKKIASHLKKLRDSGVSVLVRNCDPNVTERMISLCYDMRLDNIRIISSASGRVFKKYKARPKVATRAVCVHDGSTYTFIDGLCTAAMLRHTFRMTDFMTYIGMGMSFAIILILSVLNVIADLPAIFIILMQAVIAGAFIGVTRISCGK